MRMREHRHSEETKARIIRETYKALVEDEDVTWVRHSRTGAIGGPRKREIWIPSIRRWVRIHDCAISGCGEYVYPGFIWRWLYRRAITLKGLPRE